jgi:hypothetical protein
MIKVPRNPDDDPKNPNTEFRTVVDPAEMESLLISRNQKHFSQAKETPLAATSISELLSWGAQLPAADSILDGTQDLPSLTPDSCAQLIFQAMQTNQPRITYNNFHGRS